MPAGGIEEDARANGDESIVDDHEQPHTVMKGNVPAARQSWITAVPLAGW